MTSLNNTEAHHLINTSSQEGAKENDIVLLWVPITRAGRGGIFWVAILDVFVHQAPIYLAVKEVGEMWLLPAQANTNVTATDSISIYSNVINGNRLKSGYESPL